MDKSAPITPTTASRHFQSDYWLEPDDFAPSPNPMLITVNDCFAYSDNLPMSYVSRAESKSHSTSRADQARGESRRLRLEDRFEETVKILREQGRLHSDESTAWLVYDLENDKNLVSINADQPMQTASMFKPLVALAFFSQVQAGNFEYTDAVRIRMEKMLQLSSNPDTNFFIDALGGPRQVEKILRNNFPDMCQDIAFVERIPPDNRTYKNKCSANDYFRFLLALWQEQLPFSSELKRMMELPGYDRIVTRAPGVPEDTRVLNKTGTTAMLCGDMGIVMATRPDGSPHPYIFVGIIEKSVRTTSYQRWAHNRAEVIRKLSGVAYHYIINESQPSSS